MSKTTSAQSKTCVICKKDCSTVERFQDQEGNYYCRPCYESIQPRGQASEASVKQSSRSAAIHPTASKPRLKPCPHCGAQITVHSVICLQCGKKLRPIFATDVEAEEWTTRSWSIGGAFEGWSPAWVSMALIVFFAIFYVLARGNQNIAIPFLLTSGVYILGVQLAVVVSAFRQSFGQCLLNLLLPGYAIYYTFNLAPEPSLKWLYSVLILLFLAILSLPAFPNFP